MIIYDNWLDKFKNYIEKVDTPIIDLGCGIGNDTLYLINKNKKVISVDFSEKALQILKKNIPAAQTVKMDIENNYKLKQNSVDLIIANLSLHYFNEEKMFDIIDKIRDTLKTDGILIFRVNSINDSNYGSNSEFEIENHYYKFLDINKRFFDVDDIKYFFKGWDILYCKEEEITTTIHSSPKILWECVVKR